ncbi:MAG: VOC family protein [Actinomycetota bacterium]|nr:VOC family protein [Actinomycetota bacterium]
MAPQYLLAGLAVARLDPALAWYERFFGRPPDVVPNETEAMWEVTDTGWVYVVADEARAGRGLMTVMVEDLDEQLAALEERGIAAGPVETAPGLFRKTIIEDPEGNVIQLGQSLSARQA